MVSDEHQLQAGDRVGTGVADVAANEIIRDKLHPPCLFLFCHIQYVGICPLTHLLQNRLCSLGISQADTITSNRRGAILSVSVILYSRDKLSPNSTSPQQTCLQCHEPESQLMLIPKP